MIVGITGSFGTGKSAASGILRKRGFTVIDVDALYHTIYRNNKALQEKIVDEFGTLDRNIIKKKVFNDKIKLKKLNAMTHPIIFKHLKKEIQKKIKKAKNKVIFVDIPLLFESKREKMFDKIVVVACSEIQQIARLLKKGKYSRKEIHQIIASQMPLFEKMRKADIIVGNSGSKKQLQQAVRKMLRIL